MLPDRSRGSCDPSISARMFRPGEEARVTGHEKRPKAAHEERRKARTNHRIAGTSDSFTSLLSAGTSFSHTSRSFASSASICCASCV